MAEAKKLEDKEQFLLGYTYFLRVIFLRLLKFTREVGKKLFNLLF
jgi:hypothetical protein